jgi:hypothetical protein
MPFKEAASLLGQLVQQSLGSRVEIHIMEVLEEPTSSCDPRLSLAPTSEPELPLGLRQVNFPVTFLEGR